MKVVFVSQGPALEANTAPFRLLETFARTSPNIATAVEFVHYPLPSFGTNFGATAIRQTVRDTTCLEHAAKIAELGPDILAISLYCWNTQNLLLVANYCRQLIPNLKIIAGGPDTADEGTRLLQANHQLDFVIEKDGELPFRELIERLLAESTDLDSVPFLTYRFNGEIKTSSSKAILSSLDEIPSPILGKPYNELVSRFYAETNVPAVILETGRGCPINCAYCQYPKSLTGKVRYFSLDRVMEELRYVRSIGVKEVYFGDGIFTVDKERTETIFNYFLNEYRECEHIHVELKLDMIPPDLIPLLRRLVEEHRIGIGAGIQTRNDTTLKRLGRPTSFGRLESNINALGLLQEGNPVRWDLITGLPGDSFDDVLDSADYILSVAPNASICIQRLQVLPGTRTRLDSSGFGLAYSTTSPYFVLKTGECSAIDLERLEIVARLEATIGRIVDAIANLGVIVQSPYRTIFRERFFTDTTSSNNAKLYRAFRSILDNMGLSPLQRKKAYETLEYSFIENAKNEPREWALLREFDSCRWPGKPSGEPSGSLRVPSALHNGYVFGFEANPAQPQAEPCGKDCWFVFLLDGIYLTCGRATAELIVNWAESGASTLQEGLAALQAANPEFAGVTEKDLEGVVKGLQSVGLLVAEPSFTRHFGF